MSGKDGKAKHCWMLSKTFEYKNFVDNAQQCFAFWIESRLPFKISSTLLSKVKHLIYESVEYFGYFL